MNLEHRILDHGQETHLYGDDLADAHSHPLASPRHTGPAHCERCEAGYNGIRATNRTSTRLRTRFQLHGVVSAQAAHFAHEILVGSNALIGAQRGHRAFRRNQIEGDRARSRLVRKQFL